MKNRTIYLWSSVVVVGVLLTLGCQPPEPTHPTTYKVTGTVTLDGSPVEGATVSFVPGKTGDPAVGKTDASGKYTLTSFGDVDGATPGEYKVTVAKYGFTEASGGTSTGEEMPADYAAPSGDDEGGKNTLPEKYQSVGNSGLSATVTQDPTQNVFDFALEGGGASQ